MPWAGVREQPRRQLRDVRHAARRRGARSLRVALWVQALREADPRVGGLLEAVSTE